MNGYIYRMKIQTTKICKSCKEEKLIEDFHMASGGYRQAICKTCESSYRKQWYSKNKERVKKQVSANNKRYIEESRVFIGKYLMKHPCVDCGETDLVVLEFDHLPQYTKSFNIGGGVTISWERLYAEIRKCEVVCCNCHKRRTVSRRGGTWESYRRQNVCDTLKTSLEDCHVVRAVVEP